MGPRSGLRCGTRLQDQRNDPEKRELEQQKMDAGARRKKSKNLKKSDDDSQSLDFTIFFEDEGQ